MEQRLSLPPGRHGAIWPYRFTGYRHWLHRHAEPEFNLVVSGTATYQVDQREYRLERHSLCWLFPAQEHLLVDQSADFAMWIAVARPALARRLASESAEAGALAAGAPAGHFCRRLSDPQARRLVALCTDLHAIAGDDALFNAGLPYLLLAAWRAWQQAADVPPRSGIHPAVERAVRLLRRGGDLDVPALARQAGLSAQRLSRLFKAQVGTGIADYRNRLRLERFLAAMDKEPGDICGAALAAGFGSYAQFHRVFTRLMGCAPSAWRRGGAAVAQH